MHALIAADDVALLRRAGLDEEDVSHSVLVAETVAALAGDLAAPPDLALAVRGALFHDLGKVSDRGIMHGLEGVRLGRELGLPEAALRVARVHVRAGVPPEEAADYGLPEGDYRPHSLEEKLGIYADKLTDILEEPGLAAGLADARSRFASILAVRPDLSKDAATAGRYLALHREIEALPRLRLVAAADLAAELSGHTPPLVLDVRRPGDRAAEPSALPGARWLDPGQAEDWIADLPRDRPAVVYCVRGGGVSRGVAGRMAAAGLDVRVLDGGLEAWKALPRQA